MNMQYSHMGLQTQFLKNAVLSYGTHIIYHRGRLKVMPAYASKGGSASLPSERQLKPSVTYLQDREISFHINPVAQRTSRVAKQLWRWISKYRPIEGLRTIQNRAFSKTVFFECFYAHIFPIFILGESNT